MANFLIKGGKKLKGEIATNSAKNSAVAILCSTVMIEGETHLVEVPEIEEVKRICEILISIGLEISYPGNHEIKIKNTGKIDTKKINKDAFIKTRSGLLLMGALSSRLKNYSLPKSTGCNLGKRTVNPYLIAMKHLGITVRETDNEYKIERTGKKDSEFTMYESGDTATENTIMAACLNQGETLIHFASPNYMVQDLCVFLKKAGADISGIGSSTLKIKGVKKLKPVKYPIMPDPIESMTFISLAITTESELTVKRCPIDFLRLELEKLRIMGQKFKILKKYKSSNGYFDLIDIKITPSKLKALPDKIYGRPYPGLNMDNLPLFVPILTRAKGRTLIHDWPYENRAIYYLDMTRLGANITLLDPHRVIIEGPTPLKSAEVVCPPALRPSVFFVISMLAAPGESLLRNVYQIERGYENLAGRLKKIGADIEVI